MKPVLVPLALAGLVLASLAAAPAARAQQGYEERYTPISGETLMRLCTGRDPMTARQCEAYIAGVSDTITSYQAARPENGSKGQPLPAYICVPGRVTGPQLRQAIGGWAEQNRDRLRLQASVVVIQALRDVFPCRQ
jgi:hypothetical protein